MPGLRTHRLLSIAADSTDTPAGGHTLTGRLGHELGELLACRNGFYAFESALHVFSLDDTVGVSLAEWNAPDGWRSEYGDLTDGYLFFAGDAVGVQFAIRDEAVHTFDPETGDGTFMASSIEDWADQILNDYAFLTGYPLAHEWQLQHGPLPAGQRLVPKVPFIAGGDFAVSNLYAMDAVSAMRMRGGLAMQMRNLPDGTKVRFRVI